MRRQEQKYLLNLAQYDSLKILLSHFMQPDSNQNFKDSYVVTSLYFDTEDLICVRQNSSGDHFKHKFRIRYYDQNLDLFFLEAKIKNGSLVNKYRQTISKIPTSIIKYPGSLDRFLKTLSTPVIPNNTFLYYYSKYNLKPLLFVEFKREAFECPLKSEFRITLDYSVSTSWFNQNSSSIGQCLEKTKAILEIKHLNSYPLWLQHWLAEMDIEQCSFSKYYESYKCLKSKQRTQHEFSESSKPRF